MNVYVSELGSGHCCLSGSSIVGPHPPLEAPKDPRLAGLTRLAGQTAPGTACLYHSNAGITSVFLYPGLWGWPTSTLPNEPSTQFQGNMKSFLKFNL